MLSNTVSRPTSELGGEEVRRGRTEGYVASVGVLTNGQIAPGSRGGVATACVTNDAAQGRHTPGATKILWRKQLVPKYTYTDL